jgi:hypothetical protein
MGTVNRKRSSHGPPRLRKGGRGAASQSRAPSNTPALHILLSNIIDFLLSAGESPEHVALELEGQAVRVKGPAYAWRSKDAKHVQTAHERFVEISGVVHDWHREPMYTNQDGDPLQLDQKSLRALVGKRFPREKVLAAVEWMLEKGVVRRTNRGRFALVGERQMVLPNEVGRAVVLNRAVTLVPQYLRIALRNANTKDAYSRDIDRDARVYCLPEKYVPLWREVARERARAFLEGMDNWLEDHARRDGEGPVREVAMHCYAYTGESRSPKSHGNKTRHKAGD